jgi:hypothetical protein
MTAMLVISVAFFVSLFGILAGSSNVTAVSFVTAGVILLVVSITWFIEVARYPGLFHTVVFATLGTAAAFLNIVAGLLTLGNVRGRS